MSDLNKAAAIFSNHIHLKDALHTLKKAGFQSVSVLVKSEEDREEAGTEVRTYSSTTYPSSKTENINRTVPGRRPTMDTTYTNTTGADSVDYEVTYVERSNKDIQDSVKEHNDDVSIKNPNALTNGATLGGVIGAVAGAATLLIPGVGPILAAGPVAAGLSAAAAGGAVGMTAGAIGGLLKDEGLPGDRVGLYRKAFDQGKAIVIVDPTGDNEDQRVLEARDILNRFRPETIDTF